MYGRLDFSRSHSFQKLLECKTRDLLFDCVFVPDVFAKSWNCAVSHLVVYLLCRAGQRNLLLEDVALLV